MSEETTMQKFFDALQERWGDPRGPGPKVTDLLVDYRFEGIAEYRRELAEKIRVLPLYDPDDRITAMDGTVREPRTMADAAEAYGRRVLALIEGSE